MLFIKLIKDCVRETLLYIEENQQYDDILEMSNMKSDKFSHDDICYTCEKLAEAGYIDIYKDLLGNISIKNITYAGHQFLDNIRDDKVWTKTKSILSKFESVSIEIISQTASKVILELIKPIQVS